VGLRKEHTNEYTPAEEHRLFMRYRALKRAGIQLVIWVEGGTYYVAMDHLAPDFSNKRSISLGEFDTLLKEHEDAPIQRLG
jgi:hypothetical protein